MGCEANAIRLEMSLHDRLQLLHRHRRIAVGGKNLVAVANRLRIIDEHIDNGGSLLPQRAHALEQLASMRGIVHADGIQIDFANLLAYLELIVAILEETVAILGQANGAQPLANDVVVRHVRVSRGGRGCCNIQRCERDLWKPRLRAAARDGGAGGGGAAAATRQWLQVVAAAGGAAAAAGRCLHSNNCSLDKEKKGKLRKRKVE